MKAGITPEKIQELNKNDVFVFGSNLAGNHIGGAAKFAFENCGAIMGNAVGLQGNSYAIPTLNESFAQLSIKDITKEVQDLEEFIKYRKDLHFLITPIGCGIAGFTEKEIAPLFAGFQEYENVSLPQSFIDIIGDVAITGIKAVNVIRDKKGDVIKMFCRDVEYNIGGICYMDGEIIPCRRGYHFCTKIIDTLAYYQRSDNVIYLNVLGCGKIYNEKDKIACSVLKILSIYSHNDNDFNSGNRNSGNRNSGNTNSGSWNSGNRNSGNTNSGNRNSGNFNSGSWNSGNTNSGSWNSGNWNSGNRNSGNTNSGSWNSGSWNSGNRNSGNRNSGNFNSGNFNSGSWNSGNRNSGMFNTKDQPLYFFNKVTDKKIKDIYFPQWLYFETVIWKNDTELTELEKKEHTYYKSVGGALIIKDYKAAAQESYQKATEEEKRSIEDIPNYDPEILFELFGIDRRKKNT